MLDWAGKTFASGVVGAAGGMAFTAFLESVGVPNPSKEALARLDEILKRLDGVAASIDEINKRIGQLASQLQIAHLDIQRTAQENVVKAAIANIQTHTSGSRHALKVPAGAGATAAVVSPISSLADWGRRRASNEALPDEAAAEFTRNVITTWDIPKAIVEIGNGLLGVSNDDGTLRAWTNLYITAMAGRAVDARHFGFYESLEQRFLYAVGVQMQAAYLVMIAKTYGSAKDEVPESARTWLATDFVARTLQPQVNLFLACVERLVFAHGAWRSPTPVRDTRSRAGPEGKLVMLAGIGVPPDARKMLLRSELIGRRLIETFRDMRKYPDMVRNHFTEVTRAQGIYVHALCLEKDLVNGEGPELKPWPRGGQKGRVLDTGSALDVGSTLVPMWKEGKEGYPRLEKPETSRMRLLRYYWAWADIGGPFETLADGKKVRDILVQPAEFKAMGLDWRGLESGYLLDLSRLYGQMPPGRAGAWRVSGVSGADQNITGRLSTEETDKPVLTQDESRAYFLAAATFHAAKPQHGGFLDRNVSAVMSCPLFSYDGLEPRTLKLHVWLSMRSGKNFTACPNFFMRGQARLTLKGPSGDVLMYDSDTYNSGVLSLWDKQISGGHVPPQATDEPVLSQAITVGATHKLEHYGLELLLRADYHGDCRGAEATVTAVFKELSFSWG